MDRSKAQAAFLAALRKTCAPPGLPVSDLADWEPRANAVGLRLWLRNVRGYLVLTWEEVEAGPAAGAGEGRMPVDFTQCGGGAPAIVRGGGL